MLAGMVVKCDRCGDFYYPFRDIRHCPKCVRWYERLVRKGWRKFVWNNGGLDAYLDHWYE